MKKLFEIWLYCVLGVAWLAGTSALMLYTVYATSAWGLVATCVSLASGPALLIWRLETAANAVKRPARYGER